MLQKVFQGSLVSVTKLLSDFKTLIDAAKLHAKGGALSDQIVFVNSNAARRGVIARTVTGDEHKRIFFTPIFFERNPLQRARTIIHELSHLELGTEDFFII